MGPAKKRDPPVELNRKLVLQNRKSVRDSMETGIPVLDSMFPIGQGQLS